MRLLERLHYLGPNLRLDRPALELRLSATQEDAELLARYRENLPEKLADLLQRLGLSPNTEWVDEGWPGALFTVQVLGWLIRSLLTTAGHAMSPHWIVQANDGGQFCLVIDGDDQDSDFAATDLAIRMLDRLAPNLVSEPGTEPPKTELNEATADFLTMARQRAMTEETRAIMRAAKNRGISVIPLDRAPYLPIENERRIRPNGLLMLGHCARQRILDGPVFVDSRGPVLELIWNRHRRESGLRGMNVPLISDPTSADQHKAILSVGNDFLCTFDRHGREWKPAQASPHEILVRLVRKLAGLSDAAAILVEFSAKSLSAAPGSSEGARGVIDFDLAPELHQLLADSGDLLDQAAHSLVRWAEPDEGSLNVPIAVVTGTNGKTTTSMMVRQILRSAGHRVGLASSRGVLIEDNMVLEGDQAATLGHLRVLDSREIDIAVLETARGGVATTGFTFDYCDVAICTNVAEDHIGLNGVHTLRDMAELKLAIIQKARKAVVLNADNEFCDFMYSRLAGTRRGIVSLSHSLEALRQKYEQAELFCVVNETGASEFLELHARGEKILELDVRDLPAAFGGRARFNLENAMQAMAACHFLGAPPDAIDRGIKHFRPGFEQLMGRLNIHHGSEFTVIMDYAHNAAGLKRFLEFAQHYEYSGKRVLVGGVPGDRSEHQARDMMGVIRGFYDEFVLRPSGQKRKLSDVMAKPKICRDELLKLGVPDQRIHMAESAIDAVRQGLELCGKGDLMVLHLTSSTQPEAWELVTQWPENPTAAEAEKPSSAR